MPKFRYTAIDAEGNQKTGRVSAGSEEQAQEKLETLGYFVQELSVETRGQKRLAPRISGGEVKTSREMLTKARPKKKETFWSSNQ